MHRPPSPPRGSRPGSPEASRGRLSHPSVPTFPAITRCPRCPHAGPLSRGGQAALESGRGRQPSRPALRQSQPALPAPTTKGALIRPPRSSPRQSGCWALALSGEVRTGARAGSRVLPAGRKMRLGVHWLAGWPGDGPSCLAAGRGGPFPPHPLPPSGLQAPAAGPSPERNRLEGGHALLGEGDGGCHSMEHSF